MMKSYNPIQPFAQLKKRHQRWTGQLSPTTRVTVNRILIAFILLLIGVSVPLPTTATVLIDLLAYLIIGGRIVYTAARNLLRGEVFDENFLMSIATIGALILGEYPEAIAVMLFYELGEVFEDVAVNRSKRSISALMDVKTTVANLLVNGQTTVVAPTSVHVGQTILIKPGEKIPLDGTVVLGHSAVDTSALTGESVPQTLQVGDTALSGAINQTGLLHVQVTKAYNDSTVAKILDLVQNATSKKTDTEKFITKFAKIYTPIVVVLALALAVMPPLLFGGDWQTWIYRALIFLVISCPCALVISVPLSFFGGIGAASKQGILVKGSNYLEALNTVDTVAFDKTGTLTRGQFQVVQLAPQAPVTATELLQMAASVEQNSTHPIAVSIVTAYAGEPFPVQDVREQAGHGLTANVAGKKVVVGNTKALQQAGVTVAPTTNPGTVIYVAVAGQYWGHLIIADEAKPDAALAIAKLKQRGIRQTVMLTGDNRTVGEAMAQQLKLDTVRSELLPADKVNVVQQLLQKAHARHKKVAFVGEGINAVS